MGGARAGGGGETAWGLRGSLTLWRRSRETGISHEHQEGFKVPREPPVLHLLMPPARRGGAPHQSALLLGSGSGRRAGREESVESEESYVGVREELERS